jgi:hypothetical protein
VIPAHGDHVEVRRRGELPFWGTFIVIPDFYPKGTVGDRAQYYVKPNGRRPEIGRAVRSVMPNEVRKLSVLELIAEAADEEHDNGPAA